MTERVVEPRLGAYSASAAPEAISEITLDERRGLWWALTMALIVVAVLLAEPFPRAASCATRKRATWGRAR